MVPQRGNLAVANHSADGKSLLLFRKTDEGLRFIGEMVYEKHHLEPAPDREGKQRQAIVFELRPLNAIIEQVEEKLPAAEPTRTLDDLRAMAKAAAGIIPQ
jgi:5-methylcytosine-specific restriction protein A